MSLNTTLLSFTVRPPIKASSLRVSVSCVTSADKVFKCVQMLIVTASLCYRAFAASADHPPDLSESVKRVLAA